MPKVIALTRATTGETVLIHPTIVNATGDLTRNLEIVSWGTDLLGMAKRFPNETFFLKGGKYNQYISFGEYTENQYHTLSGLTTFESGVHSFGIGLTVGTGLNRSMTQSAINRPLFKSKYYASNVSTSSNVRMGLYMLVNQYNCVAFAPLPLTSFVETDEVANCNYRATGYKEGYYPPLPEITPIGNYWGYRSDLFDERDGYSFMSMLNLRPDQIAMTAEQFADRNEIYYSYFVGYYWYNYQNIINPDEPIEPSQVGYPYGDKPSEPTGGNGYMETDSEPIDIPNPSESSALDSGMVSLFNISKNNLKSLASFLWSDSFIDTIKSLYTNKGDVIVGLSELPIRASGTAQSIVLGDVTTNISAFKITNRYIEKDFGSIDLTEFWGNFMDYAPYTKIELVLPYADTIALNTDLYQGKKVTLKCRIDLLSGDMLYIVGNGTSAVDFVPANCNAQIPLATKDYTDMIRNALNGVSGIASSVATGNVLGGVNSALSFVSAKPSVSGIGSLVASRGNMGVRTPFIRITRPSVSIPSTFPHEKGFRSNISAKLGTLSGFTVVESIHLDGMTCTAREKEMLLAILQSGIVL